MEPRSEADQLVRMGAEVRGHVVQVKVHEGWVKTGSTVRVAQRRAKQNVGLGLVQRETFYSSRAEALQRVMAWPTSYRKEIPL